jgi:small-conductance mechanosensitive channel
MYPQRLTTPEAKPLTVNPGPERHSIHRLILRVTLGLSLGFLGILQAFSVFPQEIPKEPQRDLSARLAEVEDQLKPLREALQEFGELTTPTATQESSVRQALGREMGLLGQLRRALENRQKAEDQTLRIAEEEDLAEIEENAGPPQFVGHEAPYSLAELDALLDRRDATEALRKALAENLTARQEALKVSEADLRHQERIIRESRASLEEASPEAAFTLRGELRLKILALELKQERREVLALEIANESRQLELADRRERRLKELAAWVEPQLALTNGELQETQARLDAEVSTAESTLTKRRILLENLEIRREKIQSEAGSENAASTVAHNVVKAARSSVELLEHRQQRAVARKKAFEIRYQFLRKELTERQDLEETCIVLRGLAGDFERQRRKEESELLNSLASLVETQTRLEGEEGDGEENRWLQEHRNELHQLIELYEADVLNLGQAISRVQRTLGSIERQLGEASFKNQFAQANELARNSWGYEILVVEGNAITLGKVLTAALFLILGTWVSRRLSRLLAQHILKRFEIDEGVVAALQTLTFYVLFLAFFLWALRLVNIPLTVFTFLGGAVAIGVGFGSQNIINNFMSGLILMAERPVKVGDLVDLDGTSGRVEFIGARSTRIRSGNNTHIIVPNSTLLESNVLNWTLSDHIIRTQMDVGVAYGSDVVEVQKQIEQAVSECECILEHPAPEILFLDFAADALLFRTMFWIQVNQPLDQDRASSRLRFRIDELFREAKISIAFPQRDIHLNQPLEVRMRKEE